MTVFQVLDTYGCELCVVVTNLNRMCAEYCSPALSPSLPVRDAVRISMSFPGMFDICVCVSLWFSSVIFIF